MLITGRTQSGKSTLIDIEDQINHHHNNVMIECPIDQFMNSYTEGELIILIDTPAIFCMQRALTAGKHLSLSEIKKQDIIIEYVKELPYCTIIKNNLTIDDFKVKIKKLLKNL